MSDFRELDNIVRTWLNYRESLRTAQTMQRGGFSVPNTKMRDFIGTINSASRRLMNELDLTNADDVWLEACGELLLNAAHNIRKQREDPTFLW